MHLLLKDLGCSSNAAKMTYLFGADDHLVKRDLRLIDWTKAGDKPAVRAGGTALRAVRCWRNS